MAIAFRSEAHNNTAGATSLVVTKPAGTVDDDLLLAVLILEGGTSPTAPAGWTALHAPEGGATGQAFATFWKVADGEGADFTFGWTGSNPASAAVLAYSGVDVDDPILTAALRAVAGTASEFRASWAAFAGCVDVMVTRLYNTSSTVIPSTGYTERLDAASANGGSIEVADKTISAAGAIAERTITGSAAAHTHLASIVLRPSGIAEPLAPYVRGVSYGDNGNGGASVTIPAIVPTPAADDVLAVVCRSGSVSGTFAVPSGFTQVGTSVTGNSQAVAAANRVCDGSEDDPVTAGFGVLGRVEGVLVHLRNAGAAEARSLVTSAAAASVATSVTTLSANALLVAVALTGGTLTSISGPVSMTALLAEVEPNTTAGVADGLCVAAAQAVQATAGPSGSKSFALGTDGGHTKASVLALLSFPYSNQPPDTPPIITPTGGVSIDRSLPQRFRWNFSDPNPSDSQSKFEIRYRVVGDPSWTTIGPVTSPNTFHDVAGGTFTADDFEWQVSVYDVLGEQSAWSASSFFTAADPSGAPSITSPTDGSTIATSVATVTWSAPSQQSYELRRVADDSGSPDTTTVYFDTGEEVASASTRALDVAFPVNNRWEHIQVRVKDGGLWTDWGSVRVEVAYTPPETPAVAVAAYQVDGVDAALQITVSNP